jgi:hypothetical protein
MSHRPTIHTGEPDFNLVAAPYRLLEYLTLGRALERCRHYFLPRLLQQKNALLFGDGDGRFLAQLLAHTPDIHAVAVDTSVSMLQLLRRNCEAAAPDAASRLRTHHASVMDYLQSPSAAPYDLVVTHFFLDCLSQPDVDALIARTVPLLTPGALWVVSDFNIPSNGPMRLPARLIVRTLYLAFRILTGLRTTRLPDHQGPLSRSGFTCISRKSFLFGLLITELWQTDTSTR